MIKQLIIFKQLIQDINHLNQLLFGMIKFLRDPFYRFVRPCRYLFAENDRKQQVGIVSGDNSKFKYSFIPNVYGIETKKHIFPFFNKTIDLSQEELKFYQKVSPNYIVALVRKNIDAESHKKTIDVENPNSQNSVIEQFYPISMYCKVKYVGEKMRLMGLFKVKVREIEEVKVESVEGVEPESELKEAYEEDDIVEENEERNNTTNEYSILPLLHLGQKKSKKSHLINYYSLKVQKLDELPLVVNSDLEVKFKYLIETYMEIYKSLDPRRGTAPILFNMLDINRLLDQIAIECSSLGLNNQDIQQYLEADTPDTRIEISQNLLQKAKYYKNYYSEVERIAANNIRSKKLHEYYSQMSKIMKMAMQGKRAKQLFIEKSTKEFNQKKPNDEIRKVFDTQIQKYQQVDDNSMESGVMKAYIEELSKIPYGIQSNDLFDLDYARQVLEEEHYGMKEVKEYILEIMAVGKLKKTLKGKIFCFIGGPGLGKTTIAKSIAKALNRKFYNISLGGANDSSVLKGHRRTYVGAYSGKIIQALKNCGTNNPVILLDEIDKMGSSYQGDPRSQLLQILDPNQNNSFIDNFVDVAVDLSNVLFICSANYEENISKPLLDRMEKIKLSSYTLHQKKLILQKHLLRRAIKNAGVNLQHFSLSPELPQILINEYSLGEPGVRYLERNLAKILQKIAYKVVTGENIPIIVDRANINQYIGNSYYRSRNHDKLGTGVAISLGQTNYGGRLTYIEAFQKSFIHKKDRKRDLLYTGSLGDVFKEAMNISYTYARNFLALVLSNKFLYQNEVHIHAPEGASKKDGSTDSLTIAAALISLSLGKKVKSGVALTGELTLQGKVLRTNGVKEKVLVAKRQKIHQIIVPYQNIPQIQELQDEIKEGIKFHFVKDYKEVHNIIFPVLDLETSKI